MPNYWRGTFSAIISGGFRSAKHFLKAGLISDSTCPFCGQQEEDIIHIFLDCPAWAATRLKYPGVDFEWLRQRNACTKLCAIPVVPAAVLEFSKSGNSDDQLENPRPLSANDLLLETIKDSHVVVWTDGSCHLQDNPYLRRAGYGVIYDHDRLHSRTISKPLLGLEQTAQRAELRAVLAALIIENRPLHVRSDSSYVVDGVNNLLQGATVPFDGDNVDLWRQVADLLAHRFHSFRISWVKGHASAADVESGISTNEDQAGNATADAAAVQGTQTHCCSDALVKSFSQHQQHSELVAFMYTEKLLTYASKKHSESEAMSSAVGISDYFFHNDAGQSLMPRFKKFPALKKSVRFPFGDLAWNGLSWYLAQLKWPKDDAGSLGVTWIELALDFELSTGLTLPRGASVCEAHFGSRRLGRHASWTSSSQKSSDIKLEHTLEKIVRNKKLRFRCIVCDRTGAWPERNRFLKQSCAGYKETPHQAMKRQKLERDLKRCVSASPIAPASL